MRRWRWAAPAAGLLAACIAAPAMAAEWCLHDPSLPIVLPRGASLTVYVTEGVMGSEHQGTLALAKASYSTHMTKEDGAFVTVSDYIPTDSLGAFPTEMIVSSQPFGSGHVCGSTTSM